MAGSQNKGPKERIIEVNVEIEPPSVYDLFEIDNRVKALAWKYRYDPLRPTQEDINEVIKEYEAEILGDLVYDMAKVHNGKGGWAMKPENYDERNKTNNHL